MMSGIQVINPLPGTLMGIIDHRTMDRFAIRTTVTKEFVRVEVIEMIGPGEDKTHSVQTIPNHY